ncbi:MAG: PLP-dependent transferase, partial [Advenella sp.]
ALTLFGIGYSWGGYESLVQWVDTGALRSHAYFGDHAKGDAQVARLHIGLESVDDLIADLQQAMGKAGVV